MTGVQEALLAAMKREPLAAQAICKISAAADALTAERDAALELAYIGEHRFPENTYKARCDELVSDLRKAEGERDALRVEIEGHRQDGQATQALYKSWHNRALAAEDALRALIYACELEPERDTAMAVLLVSAKKDVALDKAREVLGMA